MMKGIPNQHWKSFALNGTQKCAKGGWSNNVLQLKRASELKFLNGPQDCWITFLAVVGGREGGRGECVGFESWKLVSGRGKINSHWGLKNRKNWLPPREPLCFPFNYSQLYLLNMANSCQKASQLFVGLNKRGINFSAQ